MILHAGISAVDSEADYPMMTACKPTALPQPAMDDAHAPETRRAYSNMEMASCAPQRAGEEPGRLGRVRQAAPHARPAGHALQLAQDGRQQAALPCSAQYSLSVAELLQYHTVLLIFGPCCLPQMTGIRLLLPADIMFRVTELMCMYRLPP